MSAWQRRKGSSGEREWCHFLRKQGYKGAERTLDQPRAGGGDVPVPPILWEVKRRSKNVAYMFMAQANEAVDKYPDCEIPAVALRADYEGWLVILKAEDFFELMRQRQLQSAALEDLL